MSKYFGPGFEARVFGPHGVEALSTRIKESLSVSGLIREEIVAGSGLSLVNSIRKLKNVVEPIDRSTGAPVYEHGAYGQSFFNGGVMAVTALRQYASAKELDLLANFRAPDYRPEEGDDALEVKALNANIILDIGQIGYRIAEAYESLFEVIEAEVAVDARFINAARAGFGYPFYVANMFIEGYKASAMLEAEKQLDAGSFEWDEGLSRLLSE